jgi:hypothetical protein
MKTPDEIKKGLECCASIANCADGCPYHVIVEGSFGCEEMGCEDGLLPDALAYIQKLEKMLGESFARNAPALEAAYGLADKVKKLESQVPRWISVEERLPEYGRYLVITRKGDRMFKVQTATYNNMGWWMHANFGEITHWMPLPEPPAEE